MENIPGTAFILLITLFTCSCVDDIDIVNPEISQKLVVQCTMSPENGVQAFISKTGIIGQSTVNERVFDANVMLKNLQTQEVKELIYLQEDEIYSLKGLSIEEGDRFDLEVFIPESDVESVSSNTSIPQSAVYEISDVESMSDGIKLELNIQGFDAKYLHIIPEASYYELDGGSHADVYEFLEILESSELFVGTEILAHLNGVLLKVDELDQNRLILNLSAPSLNNSLIKASHLLVNVRSVSEAYYEFNKSLSRQITASESPIFEPVLSYSNIEGGHGFFGSFISVLDSIPL